jgi:hypothetical protein
VTVTWTLKLELVDKAGAPDPATPGSGAAVDLGRTNAGVGTHEPQKATVEPGVRRPFSSGTTPTPSRASRRASTPAITPTLARTATRA